MYCNKCGNEIIEGNEFCSKCGTKIKQSSKKEKKEMSKGKRIFVVVLLSILFIFSSLGLISGAGEIFSELSSGKTDVLPATCLILVLAILCGYELRKNILKLIEKDKKELTEEQLQKRKKRNTIFGLSSITAVVLIMVIMFGYANISESKEKEQMISKIKEYKDNDYFVCSDKEFQELETYSNSEVKKILDSIETKKKLFRGI